MDPIRVCRVNLILALSGYLSKFPMHMGSCTLRNEGSTTAY